MRDALRREFEAELAIGQYMHSKSVETDQHTVVFLQNSEIVRLTGDIESPHPVFYAVSGDNENLYVNHDGIDPTPEQTAEGFNHENLHLLLQRMWTEDPDDVELMLMNQFIDTLNHVALEIFSDEVSASSGW